MLLVGKWNLGEGECSLSVVHGDYRGNPKIRTPGPWTLPPPLRTGPRTPLKRRNNRFDIPFVFCFGVANV